VSVACAVRESELTNYTIKIYDIFTIGSLAAAAVSIKFKNKSFKFYEIS